MNVLEELCALSACAHRLSGVLRELDQLKESEE